MNVHWLTTARSRLVWDSLVNFWLVTLLQWLVKTLVLLSDSKGRVGAGRSVRDGQVHQPIISYDWLSDQVIGCVTRLWISRVGCPLPRKSAVWSQFNQLLHDFIYWWLSGLPCFLCHSSKLLLPTDVSERYMSLADALYKAEHQRGRHQLPA